MQPSTFLHVYMLSCFSRVQLFATPGTIAHQAPLSMGFSRQDYWSGLPFSSSGDLPDSGIKPRSPALQADSLLCEPPGKPWTPGISSRDWSVGDRSGTICEAFLEPSRSIFSSVAQPCSTLRDPHGLQHARLPCPSPTPGACSNSCPLSRWCHPTISSSVIPFSSCLQSFPASESFPMSQFFASCGQGIGVLVSASVLPMNIQDWFPLGLTGWISWQSKGLSRVFSNTTVQKHQFFNAQLSLLSNPHVHMRLFPGGSDGKASAYNAENPGSISGFDPWKIPWTESHGVSESRTRLNNFTYFLSHSYMTTGKTIALTRRTFVGKVISLLFNMLSRLVIAFLPRSKCLDFTAAVTICSDFGAQENKVSHCFHCFPIYLPWRHPFFMYIHLLQPHHTRLWLFSLSLDLISFTTSPCVCLCV